MSLYTRSFMINESIFQSSDARCSSSVARCAFWCPAITHRRHHRKRQVPSRAKLKKHLVANLELECTTTVQNLKFALPTPSHEIDHAEPLCRGHLHTGVQQRERSAGKGSSPVGHVITELKSSASGSRDPIVSLHARRLRARGSYAISNSSRSPCFPCSF